MYAKMDTRELTITVALVCDGNTMHSIGHTPVQWQYMTTYVHVAQPSLNFLLYS